MSEGILINKTSGTSFISYALARVIAPAGSSVTLRSPRGTTKTITSDKAKPLENNTNFNVYYFNVGTAEFGSCTITGVDGSYTMTKTIAITNNVEYTIELFHRLPSGYQEVEYVRMPAKSYTVTDIVIPSTAGLYDYFWTIREVSNVGSETAQWTGGTIIYSHSSARDIFISAWGTGESGVFPLNTWTDVAFRHTSSAGGYRFIYNGTTTGTIDHGNFTMGGTLILNSGYDYTNGAYAGCTNDWKNFKIVKYANNEVLAELVPCYQISSGKIGMYNIITGSFYTNKGAVSFEKGPNV